MKKSFLLMLAVMLAVCLTAASVTGTNAGAAEGSLDCETVRMGGSSRFETSALIAREGWDEAKCAVIASAESYADALAGVPLAYALDAPILLARGDKLDDSVKKELEELKPEKLLILGGEAVVSKALEDTLSESYSIERIAGKDRYETGLKVAERLAEIKGSPDCIFAACADNYPDALAGGAVAAIKGCPIVYVNNKGDNSALARFVTGEVDISGSDAPAPIESPDVDAPVAPPDDEKPDAPSADDTGSDVSASDVSASDVSASDVSSSDKAADKAGASSAERLEKGSAIKGGCRSVIVLGGKAAVSDDVAAQLEKMGFTDCERISGADRYQTALAVARRYEGLFSGSGACLATGQSFPDALAGGVLAARRAMPLLLVNNTSTVGGLYDYLNDHGCKKMYVLGGASAVSDYTLECLRGNVTMTTTTTTTTTASTTKATTSTQPVSGKNNKYIVSPNYRSKYYIVVYKNTQTVGVYGKDKNGNYNVLTRAMKCSTGKNETPTPNGVFSIQVKYRWRLMMGDVYAQYACRFAPDILFHSVIYSEQDPSKLFVNSYYNLGHKASHGCVRLCVRDAKWVYDNVPVGTQVNVVEAKGPVGLSIPSVRSGSKYAGWEPSDPNPKSPYNKK